MIEKYASEVLEMYFQRKTQGILSVNLNHPSPANLRNECISKFRNTSNNADRMIINSFFGKSPIEGLCEATIRRSDLDKFRPLINFINKRTRTHQKNVELLAWLMDFELRPYAVFNNPDLKIAVKCDLEKNQDTRNLKGFSPKATVNSPYVENTPLKIDLNNQIEFATRPITKIDYVEPVSYTANCRAKNEGIMRKSRNNETVNILQRNVAELTRGYKTSKDKELFKIKSDMLGIESLISIEYPNGVVVKVPVNQHAIIADLIAIRT